jgi:hypothetical protein
LNVSKCKEQEDIVSEEEPEVVPAAAEVQEAPKAKVDTEKSGRGEMRAKFAARKARCFQNKGFWEHRNGKSG